MYMFSVYVCQCIYNEWKGFLGWTSELRAIFGRSLKEQETTLLRTVNSFNLPIFFPWVILWRFLLLLDCSVDWVSVKWVISWIWWEGLTLCIVVYLIGSFYTSWRCSMATVWLCYREHGRISTPPTSYDCLSSVATHCCFSLYIHSGTFWSWIPCEFQIW
jgi:hypothetical protein